MVTHPEPDARNPYLADVRAHRAIRPGSAAIADFDFRRPLYRPHYHAQSGSGAESRLEHYMFEPGASNVVIDPSSAQANDTPVAERKFSNPDEVNFAQREQNLSWSMELGDSNTIESGRWFTPEDKGAAKVSAAVEVRERLGIDLGDKLTFDVAGETFTAEVSSFRNVKWDSLQPNFFLMFPEGFLDGTATFTASARTFSGSGVKSSPGLMNRSCSNPYWRS